MYKKTFRWIVTIALISGCHAVSAQSNAQKFIDRVMAVLPPGEALEMLSNQQSTGKLQPDTYYEFGNGICNGLERGMDRKQILDESLYQFWGKELSDAMYEAALDTICPQLRR